MTGLHGWAGLDERCWNCEETARWILIVLGGTDVFSNIELLLNVPRRSGHLAEEGWDTCWVISVQQITHMSYRGIERQR